MKHLTLAFLIIGLSGGLFITFIGSAHLMPTTASEQSETPTSVYNLKQKYLVSMLNQVQLAAQLQENCPERVPDWFKTKLAQYVRELNRDFQSHAFSKEVLQAIRDYHLQSGKPIPADVHAIFLKELKTYESEMIWTRSIQIGESIAARKPECDSTHLPTTTSVH